MTETSTSAQLDVAIVGGGVSGLYTAWRILLEAEEKGAAKPSVVVFEAGERLGGRLLTWFPVGREAGLRAELGGMRFFDSQALVWSLLDELDFASDKVDFAVDGKNLRLLLRGLSGTLDPPKARDRYRLGGSTKGKSASEILEGVIETVMKTKENRAVLERLLGGEEPSSREQWDTIKPFLTWRDRRLWDVGFWNMLSDIYDPETYQFISDAFGYYSIAANWNAAEAMQSIALDFTQDPAYKTLRHGYQALPDALADRVRGLGGEIRTGHRLVSFDRGAGGTASAVFADGPRRYQETAKALVLAIPRRSLQLLAPSPAFDLEGDPKLKKLIDTITPTPAFKLFLFYDRRWWEAENIQIKKGRSISDLPLRQTYYMAPDAANEGKKSPDFGVLMASYDDQRAVEFWQGLIPPADQLEAGREQLRRSLAKLVADDPVATDEGIEDPPPHLHKAPPLMIKHAREQLALLHDLEEIPEPADAAFADWTFDPYGGGWNFWEPQVDVREAMTEIKHPIDDLPAYVVGEAYSGVQGWVEGALTSSELVLQKYLGLDWPKWLDRSYYLGW